MFKRNWIFTAVVLVALICCIAGAVSADLIWPIPEPYDIDYLVLVNKENPLPGTWEEELRKRD